VWEKLGGLLFRPVPDVQHMIGALESLMPLGQFRMGLHVRMGSNWFDQSDAAEGVNRHSDLPIYTAKCAAGVIPYHQREQAMTWVVVSDKAKAKSIARYYIAELEVSEVHREKLGPEAIDEAVLDALMLTSINAKWLAILEVKLYQYQTGSRVIIVERAVNRTSSLDMQVALAEMMILTKVDRLVRTQGSTYTTAGYALSPKPTWVVLDGGNHAGMCHLQATSEPMPLGNSPNIDNQIHASAQCFKEKNNRKRMMTYPWIFTSH